MVAWLIGNRTASAVTTSEMLPCFTVSACTGTSGGTSSSLLEQAVSGSNDRRARAALRPANFEERAILLKDSGQSLEIRECQPVAGLAIIVIVAGKHQRILRIHDFESCGLAGLVAQVCE